MNRILVGVDGSPESKQAAEFAAQLARPLHAELLLEFVAPRPVPFGPEPYAVGLAEWEMAEREYGNAVLREMANRCAEGGLKVSTRFDSGGPAETLAEVATKEKADLVVVGHRGRGAVKRMLLGSVADRLAQISPKPVLVFRGETA
ncbi:MAG TPA: universal stress protein [Myxococcales bacterium]|nr:universal stress protein [Myxococcales bacterium]